MKKHFNILFVYFSLSAMLFANIGIAVNKHICYTEGITEYSFLHSNHCENHVVANTSSCCKKPEATNTVNKNCCDENIIYAKLNVDYQTLDIQPFKTKTYFFTLFSYSSSFIAASFTVKNDNTDFKPPLLQVFIQAKYILSRLSIFRI